MNKIVFFLFTKLLGCDSTPAFYKDSKKEDLARVPLIEPYELMNVSNKSNGEMFYMWGLGLKKKHNMLNDFYDDGLNVSQVNVIDSVIYGHGKDREAFPNLWFVINTKNNEEMVFKDEESWKSKLKELNCKDSLFKIWPLYEEFKKSGKLPWYRHN